MDTPLKDKAMSERLSDEQRYRLAELATVLGNRSDSLDRFRAEAIRVALSESLATAEREKKLGVSQRRGD